MSLQNAIAVNTVVVFSKTYCPYSKAAKELLAEEYADLKPTTIFELDKRDDGDKIQDYLEEKTGQRSVPNIFINRKHIGGKFLSFYDSVVGDQKVSFYSGSDALKELHEKGEIRPLLG
ncbi:thioredoxin-like protein [Russula dissimulans]|nr:thioredoxin-like protein [Russula dissimulans]